MLTRRHNGRGGRGGAVNDPSAGPSLSAETAGQTATADQGDDDDEDDDSNDDSNKFQNVWILIVVIIKPAKPARSRTTISIPGGPTAVSEVIRVIWAGTCLVSDIFRVQEGIGFSRAVAQCH
jgi:hypothetical protein